MILRPRRLLALPLLALSSHACGQELLINAGAEAGDLSGWTLDGSEFPAGDAVLEEGDVAYVREAFALLPAEPWGADTWATWTSAVKQASGRKGRALFMPLRIALTGSRSGPELADLLPLIGREGTLARRP